jgi:DNA replication protein DnaC
MPTNAAPHTAPRLASTRPAAAPTAMPAPASQDDLHAHIRQHLETLGMTHTLAHLDEHLAWALRESATATALLDRLLGAEAAVRRERRIERRVALSGLRESKTFEAFDWDFQPTLDRPRVLDLARLDFVRRAEDLVLTGQSGTGKSHILQALGLRACQQQIYVRYARCVDLLDDLFAGLADGSYPDRLKRWTAPALLIIDDVGLGQVKKRDDEPTAAHTLFNLIDRRHARLSTAISSNIRLSDWGKYLGDATVAAAILDRLVMRALRIDINGPSYRQHLARRHAAVPEPPPDSPQDAPNTEPTAPPSTPPAAATPEPPAATPAPPAARANVAPVHTKSTPRARPRPSNR